VTPVLTYADRHASTRDFQVQLRELLNRMDAIEAMYQQTGVPIHAAYAPVQICRLHTEAPVRGRVVVRIMKKQLLERHFRA
jgi:hypothetical protein